MITQIEMLEKRIEFLEEQLIRLVGRIDDMDDIWNDLYDKFQTY